MTLATAPLPSDLAELRAFAASLQAELYAKTLHVEKLKTQLALLRRARFGRSSEKLDGEIEQLELLIGELEESQAESIARRHSVERAPAPKRERSVPVRKKLPDHLPRERVEHEAVCACPACGGTVMTMIGADEREVLEYVPSHFKAIVHVRPKWSCRACETITQPPMPSLPIERGLPGPGLLAHVIISKYCDHLPLYRQSGIYARSGVNIDRSTMADWVGSTAFLLEPLSHRIAQHVRAGAAIHADDTPVPVLDPGRNRAKTGQLWVAVRDERPWGSGVPPGVFYRYAPDRKAEQAEALLGSCEGFLHADAYAGFNTLYEPHPMTGVARLTEVACRAHARRKIYEVHVATASPAAQRLLERIGDLFAIEDDIRGRRAEERLAVRAERSVPLLAQLKEEYAAALGQVSAKGSFAQA